MALILTGTSGSTTLDSSAGLTFSDSSNQAAAASPYVLKNRLINGGMDIWQRATSFTNSGTTTSSASYSTADRFQAFRVGGVNGLNPSQQTSGAPSGFKYYMRLQRASGDTSTNAIYMAQSIETVNMLDMAGKSITLQFLARVGSNFSASASGIIATIFYGTGTDGSIATGFTSQANVATTTVTGTTSWQTFTLTGTVPSNATQLGIAIIYNPTGTAGANDYLDVVGLQLEIGSTATPFERRFYGQELTLCQRYYETSYPSTVTPGTFGYVGPAEVSARTTSNGFCFYTVPYSVQKRATPSISLYSYNGTANQLSSFDSGANLGAASALQITAYSFLLCNNSGGNIADGSPITINFAANAEL
jgi:hypothetical protein